jgi:AraC-like DNA-binding protein
MESLIINMDNFFKHWDPTPRTFPSLFPVSVLGYYSDKNEIMDREFYTCNFSLILQGSGNYAVGDRIIPFQAPCVLLQWPGVRFTYGPDPNKAERWEEFFLIYPATVRKALERTGFFTPEIPIYPLANPAAVRRAMEKLRVLGDARRPGLVVDQVDRLCEQILLDTRIRGLEAPPGETVIERIHERMTDDYAKVIDLSALARQHGLSDATFRRLWKAQYGEPPWQYVLSLRIQAACSLLVETRLPVKSIAARVGFEDALYFSRRFQGAVGISPRDYRKRNRLDLPR